MKNSINPKKEFHYSIKIASALYGIILYLYTPILIMKITNCDLSKNIRTTISLVIAAILCFWFLPGVIGIPEKGTIKDNLMRIGFKRQKMEFTYSSGSNFSRNYFNRNVNWLPIDWTI